APPGRLPRTACSAGRPGRAHPRRAGGGKRRSGGGRAARWSRRRSRRSRSTARRPMSSAGHGPRRGVCLAAMDAFQGRVAVITGGGGGIGAAMARAFAARGARIVLADVDRAAMEAVAAALGRGGTEVLAVPTDVTALEIVVGLTEALHRELAEQGIGVSVLCPMIVETNINENSIRNRPAALQNPGGAAVPEGAAMAGSVIRPEEVARRVVRGIERKDLYIFTHPDHRPILQRRAARQHRMFAPDRW